MTVFDVFTPSSPATGKIYVERSYLNKQLKKALFTPGMQIILFGKSGSGKSSFILNKYNLKFDKNVKSICKKGTLFSEMLLDAFDQLNKYYLSEYSNGGKDTITGEASISFWKAITASAGTELTTESSNNFDRVVSFQLNERNLSKLLKENNCCWIIEDFHKVDRSEKSKLADSLKLFTDDGSKVIAIGAVTSASEVLEMNEDMENRVAEIRVSTMDDEELLEIIDRGSKELNINIATEVKSLIVRFSSGYAAKCHQLCLNLCEYKDIFEKQKRSITLGIDDFRAALSDFIFNKSDTFSNLLKRAIMKDGEFFSLHEEILKVFLNNMEYSLTPMSIAADLRFLVDDIEVALEGLSSHTHGSVLRKEYNEYKYSFSDPFFLYYCISIYKKTIKETKFTKEDMDLLFYMNTCKVLMYIHDYDELRGI
ncbi:MAG: hypothetical protein ACRBG0_09495 [Lewinella sp.]|uniref:hypothetical protein n=1 Tax=Lewinella sp. TaxID=2004506 RepID=UPI003D6B7893